MKCKTHPKYKAINPPTAPCDQCRLMWDEAGKSRIKMAGKALSSGDVLPVWQVPLSLVEAAARRMKKGNDKGYPIHNWRGGLDDVTFLRDRASHAATHLFHLLNGDNTIDDAQGNADAITWFMCLFNEALRLYPDTVSRAFYTESRNERTVQQGRTRKDRTKSARTLPKRKR